MTKATTKTASAAEFLAALAASDFQGNIHQDIATRTVMATDNSIYELLPKAVIFPKFPDDLNVVARLASQHGVALTARGGGTGTNGQSLTEGVIVDCSRFLTQIEEINVAEGYAIVQPGVILDDLNRAVGKHGLFFAPTVSTASRATLGGMAATDASGKGSRIYGRMSDHVLQMDVALVDGSSLHTDDPQQTRFDQLVRSIATLHASRIKEVYPQMNRGLTGYNLDQAFQDGQVSLIKLLCGSEGSLALTKRLKLRLLPKPQFKALMVVAYDDTLAALQDVQRLAQAKPTAIEFIDDKILDLAQQDPVWQAISDVLDTKGARRILGLNFVEVQTETQAALADKMAGLNAMVATPSAAMVDAKLVTDAPTIAALWSLRSKCVGLLGRMDPTRQGTAFVEDAAVPPENLVGFVEGFRQILNDRGLAYGMFGHADVGCVHVRPALNMRQSEDAAMIRQVSDAVHKLALSHGGLIWGEHGKGFRGEYGPDVFGPDLYAAICQIKAAFDPENLLNPGKIASPSPAQPLIPLDAPPFRGSRDATITTPLADQFQDAIKCNGNGQCFNRDFDDVMCPSYKATGDRRYSPKGRAALLRTWARAVSQDAATPDIAALDAELHDSLSACLSCKACTSQCPIKVDIPQLRSQFYDRYYATRRRPLRHHLYAMLERLGPWMTASPRLSNLGLRLAAPVLEQFGLVDLPKVAPSQRLASTSKGPKVVLIEDSFLATFDGCVLDACAALLDHLGFDVLRSGTLATGKPLQVIGKSSAFAHTAKETLTRIADLAAGGTPLISIEPAFSSMFQQEYRKLGLTIPPVDPIEGFLNRHLATQPPRPATSTTPVLLFNHCSETTTNSATRQNWQSVFEHLGLSISLAKTGCCGMAGMFGHEANNKPLSQQIFDLSWAPKLRDTQAQVAATGFSCRCQAKRFAGIDMPHPAEVLLAHLNA